MHCPDTCHIVINSDKIKKKLKREKTCFACTKKTIKQLNVIPRNIATYALHNTKLIYGCCEEKNSQGSTNGAKR